MILNSAGKQETSTKLADFCAHALLALEVLIHPRALPVEDFTFANRISDGVHKCQEKIYSGNPKYITPFSSGANGMGQNDLDSDHDDLCDSWLENGKEAEATASDAGETIKYVEMIPSETLAACQDIKLLDNGSDKGILEESKQNPEVAAKADMEEIQRGGDEIMTESSQHPERTPQNQDPVSARLSSVPATIDVSTGAQIALDKITPDNGMDTDQDVLGARTDVGTPIASTSDRTVDFTSEMDHESDMEPFPDIVDADPDSDY